MSYQRGFRFFDDVTSGKKANESENRTVYSKSEANQIDGINGTNKKKNNNALHNKNNNDINDGALSRLVQVTTGETLKNQIVSVHLCMFAYVCMLLCFLLIYTYVILA